MSLLGLALQLDVDWRCILYQCFRAEVIMMQIIQLID